MSVRYVVSTEASGYKRSLWQGNDVAILSNEPKDGRYIKEVFFPSPLTPQPIWLWVLGHERAVPNKAIVGREWKSSLALHVCVGGTGYYNGQQIGCGDCFLVWPKHRHTIVSDANDPFEYYWLILRGKEIERFMRERGFSATAPILRCAAPDRVKELFRLGMHADYGNVDVVRYTTGLVQMILACHMHGDEQVVPPRERLHTAPVYGKQRVIEVKQLLRESNYALSVESVASTVGLTPKYLSRVFHRETGRTLKQYILNHRFLLAASLLRGGMPPTEAALTVGYTDYTAFWRGFLKVYAVTPTQYIENQAKIGEIGDDDTASIHPLDD